MNENIDHQATVDDCHRGQRLDWVVSQMFPDYSRARLQKWIKDGQLKVNGESLRAKDKLRGGELIQITARLETVDESWQAEAIRLDVVFEDDSIIVINKPAGLVVHPAAGNRDGTLLNALLYHCPSLQHLPRAGIVHRLDKDTTGLMVVAKTVAAHTDLVAQIQQRSVSREYEAIVNGVLIGGGTVEAPIARHPSQRKKMAVVPGGKEAVTHFRVIKRYVAHSHIRLILETGRTHQIRVHMAHRKYPLVGDPLYGGRLKLHKGIASQLESELRKFNRQALHAKKLGLNHPESDDWMEWQAPTPDDFCQMLVALEVDFNGAGA